MKINKLAAKNFKSTILPGLWNRLQSLATKIYVSITRQLSDNITCCKKKFLKLKTLLRAYLQSNIATRMGGSSQ